MTRTSVPAELAVLTWPTLAWITAWQVMNAGPAANASQGADKPRRKRSRKRRARKRKTPSAKIIRFPAERVVRPPAGARRGAAKIIPLPDSA